ncbi:TBC-domain-containing protein [Aspergillus ruber CBS 135680]|uniref:TBC-domain-containing protein n=1 Tax=Aspergillus ruber (strain CBS 135680) TaxID=1388766 RepID=A0A017S9A4_ASPRC|nr:TBC-domain-containing protein [Aspergillus ruber CBS 135680]EYE93603.1 TBC-domain-containing protein [Aspergillus ruber CBS 135680]
MTSRPTQAQLNLAALASPSPSPQTMRSLRKIQSHHTLSSNTSSDLQSITSAANTDESSIATQQHHHQQQHQRQLASPARIRTHGRGRSNSDTGSREATLTVPKKRRPARKTGSGIGVKRSLLESYLRDGPLDGNLAEGMQELRYLVLSTRVEADVDGMSTYRVYLWLVLLDIPPAPTDEYLSLIHRGRSPAYTKIRNDTFRTLATDPLFKRRVTEASLIRLLNAVAWKLEDAKGNRRRKSRPSSRRREMESLIKTPPRIAEEDEDEFVVVDNNTTFTTPFTSTATTPNDNNDNSNARGNESESAIYVQGMNVLCAPFLYAARSEVEAFALFHHFVTRECPGYIRSAMDGVHRGLRLVDRCLEVVEPKLAAYLFSKGMQAELYAFPSVLTLCACTPPLPEVLHLWDFLFAYGPHLNILCIVAQLIRMKDTILESPRYVYSPDQKNMLTN